MKQPLLTCILLLIFSSLCPGQHYSPIVLPDTSIWYFGNRQMPGDFIDTIFAKEQEEDWINLYYKGSFFNNELTFAGKTKSNNNHSKLWYLAPNSEDTLLIFNLDLDVGDSIVYPYSYSHVHKVYYEEDRKIIEFDFTTEWGTKGQFIEGVGPNLTLLYHWQEAYFNSIVACKFEGNEHVYTIYSPLYFDNCHALNTGIETIEKSAIKIYPNPFNNGLEIEIDDTGQDYEIAVKDMHGRIIIKQESSGNCTTLNTSRLKKGNYLLTLNSENNCFYFKIVKE